MMTLRKCPRCNAYSLKAVCSCGAKTVNPHPAKFSLISKYAKYRRMTKKLQATGC